MITPLEIESKEFKIAFTRGYDKVDVDSFRKDILRDYEKMYKENLDFKDKLAILQDGIQYYKSMEETLQKTLLLAEKTADETRSSARAVATQIEKDAALEAQILLINAKQELSNIHKETEALSQHYEIQKTYIKQILLTQLEFIDNNRTTINQVVADTDTDQIK